MSDTDASEIERLRESEAWWYLQDCIRELDAENARLQAENARLRDLQGNSALRRIVKVVGDE